MVCVVLSAPTFQGYYKAPAFRHGVRLPIRIWIAGCSTGEEAYSIAMGLLEFFSEQQLNSSIQIFATDINDVAIEKARVGIYTPSQVAEMSPERLQRFFVKVDNGYQISKTVRELCVFARQNLMSDPPFSRLDLITCRNVLIYLGSAVQKKLLPIFHYGLNSTGFLMLGTSETVGEFSDLFTLVNRKYKIYSRKMTSTPQGIDLVTSNYFPEVLKTRPIVNEDTWNNLELLEEADRIVLNQYAPVGVVINSNLEILQFRGQTSSYLEPAPGRPSFNLLKMAKQDLRIELRTTIHQSRRQGVPVKKEGVNLRDGDRIRQVTIHVIPFKLTNGGESYFLVLFEDAPPTTIAGTQTTGERTPNSRRRKTQTHEAEKTAQLQQELATTKEYLQSIIEEQQATNQDLRAANEEILSSNEELQSTNEELETAKEEIQATNEELNTINDELRRRNIESTQVSNDLQNLLSNINIPILMLGGDLRIRRFTPIAGKIFNLIPTDVGRPLSDINHNLNVPDLEIQILEVINNLNFKTQEVQDQDGHWYDLRIRPYRTIDNKIDGAVVVLVDIDALKHSAEQMRASRDYAKAIVDTVRESLVVLDVNLQVITANRCFYETFQVLPTETEQRLIFDLGNGQWNIPQLRSLLENVLPNGTPFQDLEIEHYFEQIGHKTMRFNARRMPQLDEAPRILLVIEDITHQKQLEAERAQLLTQEQAARFAAEASNRTKDEFLSTLSHELRNPLHSSLGWVQLLRQQQLDETTTNQALAAIEQSIQIQAHLIDDLLDISRISSGKLHLEVQELNLSKVIEAALEVVRFSADAKNIEIVSTLNDSPRRILGDPNRLRQILWNLLSNAIKFTPSGGTIKVTLEYVNTDVHIIVNDTGEGISPEFLPHIFERFTQADSTQKPANQGLGLGLAIVRHLVELHGGKVEAESPGKGQGSTFTVTIPLQMNFQQSQVLSNDDSEPVVSSDIPELPINSVSSLEGLRVLVVDDLANIRQVIRIILETQGVQVTAVASAQEALSTLTANPGEYDVLLSDINMPEEDGYDLIRQVRALSPEAGGEIPAVAVTSYNRESDRQAALHAGFQMHIAKPVDMNQLLFAVASLAGRWRQ
jgi:two-component system CheB/CheR fusion protein